MPVIQAPTIRVVQLADIIANQADMAEVIASGRPSTTDGPIFLAPRPDMPGKYELSDGHHRVAQALRDGETEMLAEVSAYADSDPLEGPFYAFPATDPDAALNAAALRVLNRADTLNIDSDDTAYLTAWLDPTVTSFTPGPTVEPLDRTVLREAAIQIVYDFHGGHHHRPAAEVGEWECQECGTHADDCTGGDLDLAAEPVNVPEMVPYRVTWNADGFPPVSTTVTGAPAARHLMDNLVAGGHLNVHAEAVGRAA